MGSRSSVLFADDDFHGWSALLSRAELRVADFEATIRMASQGDLVFADPPYVLKHNHNGFRKYNESIFSWQDQLRLAEVLNSAARRGVNVVLTNANHASVSELYSDQFRRVAVSRGSMVAASRHKRGSYEELLFWTEGAINEFILQER
jgi:DNA adenine methylase